MVAEVRQELVGETAALVASVVQLVQSVRSRITELLLIGESGVGKEVFARLFHQKGCPSEAPLEAVNLAGLSPSLIESELFGHEKGAFTGADRRHLGAFERAQGGTLFLDEIGYLDASLQPRLLRAIDQKRFLRVGGTEEVDFRARLVCATSVNLADAVREGKFRQDLYHRINRFEIRIPPLRERREDIHHLIRHLLRDSGVKVERETQQILESYSFPGNVRELDSLLKRALAVSDGRCLTPADLPGEIMWEREQPAEGGISGGVAPTNDSWPAAYFQSDYKEAVEDIQRQFDRAYLSHRLELAGNNRERLAREIGISSKTIISKLRACGLGHLIRGDSGDADNDSGDTE
jgi:DNA-binding NtrC family response regulator